MAGAINSMIKATRDLAATTRITRLESGFDQGVARCK